MEKSNEKEAIGVKLLYTVKHNPNGSVQKNKTKLVANGYSQQPHIDYEEIFSPVAHLDTIRALISFAAQRKYKLYQLDARLAFLDRK